jgi:two-component system response regulator YesN
VHEFYNQGITLDEIAAKLNITPEYLGTQFHKEMGINFSSYIKNFRIKKAKELLIGTHLKLYEVADKSGYGDPKYFSQVFKEATGFLPTEYRKMYK